MDLSVFGNKLFNCFQLVKAPWHNVWHGTPAATPHVGPMWMAFFATQLQGQYIHENTHSHHFCHFRKLSRPVLFNFEKVAEQWKSSKFRIITGLNIGKMWPMVAFFSKRPEFRCCCSIPATNNQPECLRMRLMRIV